MTGTVDGKPFAVQGALDWAPTKSGPGYEWISFLAIGAAVMYGAFLLFAKRARPDKPHGRSAGARS